MSFLQPMMLIALPLAAIPIIIHLINQRRYQTTRWAAMMFLLAANRMSRGYARLRQWLILFFRTLVIAGLLFAMSRPLASGWLGLVAGGQADTTIILLDRSPSMQQQGEGTVVSKLDAGRQKLVETLGMLGSSRWLLIDSATNKPRELESPEDIHKLPCTGPTSAETDLPAMLEAAYDYIQANKTGRTEIWICSDLKAADWKAENRRWDTLRKSFLELPQAVRFHLLAYPQTAPDDLAVRVTSVHRRGRGHDAELLVSLRLSRTNELNGKTAVPVRFEIGGARSELTVEMAGQQYMLKDYRIPLESGQERGWGCVSIPADVNPGNNRFYFVFDEPPPRKTIVVAENSQATWPLELAASVASDRAIDCGAEVVSPDQLNAVPWEDVSLLLWQAPLPKGKASEIAQAFVRRGGHAIFLPPRSFGDEKFLGVNWQSWTDTGKEIAIETWRGDQGLLAHTQSGLSLPVGDLKVKRYCKMAGELIQFATLRGGDPLLGRVATDRGGVHFCATTPDEADSSMASDGVVLYVAIQRALALGSAVLGNTRNLIAGQPHDGDSDGWQRLAGNEQALSTDFSLHQGVYAEADRLLAVNRSDGEDEMAVLTDTRLAGLFKGLDFVRMDDRAGDAGSLIQEIWRLFLAAMIVSMVFEALLCLPKIVPNKGAQP